MQKLMTPVFIGSRLQAAVKIGEVEISVGIEGTDTHGRTVYRWNIDGLDQEYTGNDLKSGVGGGNYTDGLCSLLSFLSACGESVNYAARTGRDGENSDMFPQSVGAWASDNVDALAMMEQEVEEAHA